MVKKVLLYFTLFIFHFSFSQTWEPLSTGLIQGDSTNLAASSLCVYNGKLYVGGSFNKAGNVKANNIASWDGKKWDTLGGGTNGFISALCVYKNRLFAGGEYTWAGGKGKYASNIAYWFDTTASTPKWHPMGRGIAGATGEKATDFCCGLILALTEYKGELFVGGSYSEAGGNQLLQRLAQWDMHNGWMKPVEKFTHDKGGLNSWYGIGGSTVVRMIKYKNDLYLTGPFNLMKDGVIQHMIVLNDTVFHAVGSGIPIDDGPAILPMAVYDSCLYVGADFNSDASKQKNGLAKWDGKNWTIIPGLKGTALIFCMAEYNGKLYIGGEFETINDKTMNNIMVWDGNTFEPVGAGLITNGVTKGCVNSLCVYKGELYAAGSFTASGGVMVNHIAKLNLKGTKPLTPKKKGNG